MRHFITALILFVLPTLVLATAPTPTEIRKIALAGDISTLSSRVAEAQAAYMSGDMTADDIRAVFIVLSRSHPEIVGSVEAWLDAEPDNPAAMIALAWSLRRAGFDVRSGQTYDSYEIGNQMLYNAAVLAERAYRINPDLIPATDAQVRMYRRGGPIQDPFGAFDYVMKTRPNWGTVLRALELFGGADMQVLAERCENAGRKFTTSEHDIGLRCQLVSAVRSRGNMQKDFILARLFSNQDPELDFERADFATRAYSPADLDVAWIDRAETYLLETDFDQFQLIRTHHIARRYDGRIAPMSGRKPLTERFRKAHLARAEAFLEHDPSNIGLMNIVEGTAWIPELKFTPMANGGMTISRIYPDRTAEERQRDKAAEAEQATDFARRRLIASPFSAKFWNDYGKTLMRFQPHRFAEIDAAVVNAIVHSGYDEFYLSQLLWNKVLQIDAFEKVTTGVDVEGGYSPEWKPAMRKINAPRDLICPFARAYRLRAEICAAMSESGKTCETLEPSQQGAYNRVIGMAEAEPGCYSVLNEPVDGLLYTPVTIDDVFPTSN